jgi:hypothetical protein
MNIPFSMVGCRKGANNGRVASDFLAYINRRMALFELICV